ncbi:membrane-associated protein, putative [Bodo saltans]|uniref:Membrane-associated protein, putative n=1 Tax=Bodo saltans TaxID=75058 RepID=A0A0S4JKA4_BODSA|nr:membrane-associated protein, putative [Bodo saltans]|eukprot:CUG91005.1 membrane-associated protein, putative [Bodo saltans]
MPVLIMCVIVVALMISATGGKSTVTITGTPGGTSAINVATRWLYFSLNPKGTIGNGNTEPGLKLSLLGNGVYGLDIVSPQTPTEGFSVSGRVGSQTFTHSNSNSGAYDIPVVTWSAKIQSGYGEDILRATWTGATTYYTITISYTLRASIPQIHISTIITAKSSQITDLAFLRFVDADQGNSVVTANVCGYESLFPSTAFVSSLGWDGTTALALFTAMEPGINVERTNTGIGFLTPSQTLTATPSTVSSMADTTINLVFLVGNVSTTRSAMLTYSYGLAPSLAALRFNRSLINLFVLTPSRTLSTSLTTTKGSSSLAISSSSSNSTSVDSMTHSATAHGKSQSFTNASSASHSGATQSSLNTASLSWTPSIPITISWTTVLSSGTDSRSPPARPSHSPSPLHRETRLTCSHPWMSRSLSISQSTSLLPSASCNPDPVTLRNGFLTSGQSVPSLVRAQSSSSIIEGAAFPSLSIPSNVAEGIQQSETAPRSSLNFTMHIATDNAALNLALVLYQMKIIALTIQNLARSEEPCGNCTTDNSTLVSVDCEWDAFASPVTAPPFIECRVFNVAMAANRFADVRLLISLVVGCDRPRSTIPVLVTLEARPPPLADIAQVISQTSLVVSVLTGNSVVGALAARSRATLRVLSCANPGSDAAGNGGLFGLEIGDGKLVESRGAIASTAIVVAFAYCGAMGVALVLGCVQVPMTSFRERLAQLYVLSYPVVIFLLFGPTVTPAAMSLVAYDVATSADIAVGAVSLLMTSLTLVFSLWHVLWIAPTKFYAKPVEEGGHQDVLTGRWYFLRSMLQRVLKKHYRWAPREITATVPSTGNNGTARRYGIIPLIDDYRILWFFIFELVNNLLSGAVAGVPGLDKSDDPSQSLFACMGLTAILLTCYLLQLGAFVVFRPLSSIFMHVYTVYTLALSCAMCASVVAFLVFVNTANNAAVASAEKSLNTDHATTATLCGVYFSILIGASTIVKAAMDGWSILCFLWHLLFHRRRIEELPPPTTVSLLNSALQNKEDIYNDDVRQDEFMGILINTFAANVEEVDEVAIAELHPTEECENVFGMESTSTDPLRELLILHQAQGEELCSAATIVE